MSELRLVDVDPDDPMLRPVYGPPCGALADHTWRLSIHEGRASLNSGCAECTAAVMDPVGGEDVEMEVEVVGKLTGHLETYGWETPEYDHWWEFQPVRIGDQT